MCCSFCPSRRTVVFSVQTILTVINLYPNVLYDCSILAPTNNKPRPSTSLYIHFILITSIINWISLNCCRKFKFLAEIHETSHVKIHVKKGIRYTVHKTFIRIRNDRHKGSFQYRTVRHKNGYVAYNRKNCLVNWIYCVALAERE